MLDTINSKADQEDPWTTILNKVTNDEVKPGLTSFINPFSMLLLKDEYKIAAGIDFWHVDGISLVNKINGYFKKNVIRMSFDETSMAPMVFGYAAKNKLKVAIIGTKEEFIHKAVANIEKKHNVKVSYYRNGYFKDEADKLACFSTIIENKIDLVVCGMGTPYQEYFLIDLKNKGWKGYGFTCGGYLHQIGNKDDYYPEFYNKFNIRWVYRIIDEPKLFTRYLIYYPKFFAGFYSFRKRNKSL